MAVKIDSQASGTEDEATGGGERERDLLTCLLRKRRVSTQTLLIFITITRPDYYAAIDVSTGERLTRIMSL